MKIVLLSDTHAGARLDSQDFIDFQVKFYTDFFFPYLRENNIKTIVHLGDVFDRRKFINFNTLYQWRKDVFSVLNEEFDTHVIQGNHDIYFRETNKVSSLNEVLKDYQNISIIDEPQVYSFKNDDKNAKPITFIPWMTHENRQACLDLILSEPTEVLFGHLELAGFDYHKGNPSKEGIDSKIFKNYDLVCSGHFHTRSSKGNIHYLGSPYEMIWSDYDDPRGFHLYDTVTKELTFVPNPYTIFLRVVYSEANTDINSYDYSQFQNKIVSVSVKDRKNYDKFELFMNRVHDAHPVDVLPLDTIVEIDSTLISKENIETKELIEEYVLAMSIDDDIKPKLIDLMFELYNSESIEA